MLKLGIITFHTPINYGAALQAYALQKKISNLGYDCELIDFRLKRIEKNRELFCFEEYKMLVGKLKVLLKRILFDLCFCLKRKKLRDNFNKFMKNSMILSPEKYFNYHELELFCQNYDTYIVGSDLVWNTDMAKGVDPVYFLDFVKDLSKNRFSYASSIGSSVIREEHKADYSRMLKNLNYISVREKTAVELLSELTDKKIVNVLDPTLLLSAKEWQKIQSSPVFKGKYILVYMVEYSVQLFECAKKIGKEKNMKIVHFNFKNYFGKNSINVSHVGPAEFIWLFANAKYIITNSFHGVVFSIIFEKEFWCIPHSTRGSRMIDLMNLLGLSDRIIQPGEELNISKNICYEVVNELLESEKEFSIKYLKDSIEKSK